MLSSRNTDALSTTESMSNGRDAEVSMFGTRPFNTPSTLKSCNPRITDNKKTHGD